jgi:peptidoglycan/LPS O-acetylase OafA/YrhL
VAGALPAIAAVVLTIWATGWPLDRFAPTPAPTGARLTGLDGLRAFLALGVVCCHLSGRHEVGFHAAEYGWPQNYFLKLAGAGSVSVFFMITGFPFWSKAIALLRTDFVLHVPAATLGRELLRFAVPGLDPAGGINGYGYGRVAVQAWSLLPELVFYLCLPLLALLASTPRRFAVGSALFWGWVAYAGGHAALMPTAFWLGMVAAYLPGRVHPRPWMIGSAASVLLLALQVVPVLWGATVVGRFAMGGLALIFYSVVLGNPGFGLLTSRGARWLGDASYSLYLLHLLVLWLLGPALDWLDDVRGHSEVRLWSSSP